MNKYTQTIRPDYTLHTAECRGGREIHVMAHAGAGSAREQGEAIKAAIAVVGAAHPEARPVFMRLFLSDPANQEALIPEVDRPLSVVGQAPLLPGCKAALWMWLRADQEEGSREVFMTGLPGACFSDGHDAARRALDKCFQGLRDAGEEPARACHRTWLFVRDIDRNYGDVVAGRNEVFDREGLTSDTHYIASTGIGAMMADRSTVMTMDAYAVVGRQPRVQYLYAPERLNRTSDYGVAFERGVSLDFGGRRLVFISGTASIDNRGEVVAPGDVAAQFDRMADNVAALLAEGGMGERDLCQAIVYLRDPADAPAVEQMFERRYGTLPHTTVLAPVCRPAWLIEMECIALC